jgi:tripartite-type tricarboxylate transporter receptor subunit TctC
MVAELRSAIAVRVMASYDLFNNKWEGRLNRRELVSAAMGVVLVAVAPGNAASQSWPSRPIRFIVPFPAGGPTDGLGRAIAEALGEILGATFVVENIGGAAGGVGFGNLARSQPDGYTIALGAIGILAINPFLYDDLSYRPLESFTPISLAAEYTNVIVIDAAHPARTLSELIAFAKANPHGVTFGSSGSGSTSHLTLELLSKQTGAPMQHIPYRGTAAALTDVIAGRITLLSDLVSTTASHIAAGSVRALATTGARRHRLLPEVPTVGEVVPGYEVTGWFAVFGPAGLPVEVATRLNKAMNDAIISAKLGDRLRGLGFDPLASSPATLRSRIEADLKLWQPLIESLNLRAK